MTEKEVIAERYEVLSELGMGAVAVVYKVRDTYLNKEFALKMMRNEQASGEQLIRFQQEAMLVAKLQHTSISTVYHCGVTDDNQPFLVMDYHDGQTLSDALEKHGPLPLSTAIDVFVQICDGIAYSHERGILHRDLKTSNVMLIKSDSSSTIPKVRILDFGLAKMTCSSGGILTRPGMALGSPAYMSPEHGHGKVLDERSDLYSMGCVMFETLTGRVPIRGATSVDTILRQISQPAPALSAVAEGKTFPPALERIVARCLEKDPADRFQSMLELKEALLKLLEEKEPAPTAVVHQPGQISTGVVIIAVAAALCIAAGIFFIFALMQDPHTEPSLSSQIKGAKSPVPLKDQAVAALPPSGAEDAPSKNKDAVDDLFSEWMDMPWEGGITWKWNQLKVEDRELIRVSKMPQFKFVSLYRAKGTFTSNGLRALLRSPYLRGIGVGTCDLTPEQLDDITLIAPHLEAVLLSDDPAIRGKDLLKLKRMPNLRLLDLSKGKFNDKALKNVAKLPNVSLLKLCSMPNLTGSGLDYLESMKSLRVLSLRGTELTDRAAWSNLAHLKQLTALSVAETGVTDEGVDELCKLKLEKLDISNNPLLTDKCLEQLHQMKSLKHLYMADCPRISNAARQTLMQAVPGVVLDDSSSIADPRSPDEILKYEGGGNP